MLPWEWSRLTDYQIAELYFRPAAERSERMKREMPSHHAGTAVYEPAADESPAPEPGTPAFKAWCIAKFTNFGLSHAEAVAMYEEQNAQWLAQQGKG